MSGGKVGRVPSVQEERVRRVGKGGLLSPIKDEDMNQVQMGHQRGPVLYWMSREMRADDNWALLFARERANQLAAPLVVAFNLVPHFLEATARQYDFLLKGLEETEADLRRKRIPFFLLRGNPANSIPLFASCRQVSEVITDMSPLRVPREWVSQVADRLESASVPFFLVDGHNVVPVWHLSSKQEPAARTLRPKMKQLQAKFLVDFPELEANCLPVELPRAPDWQDAMDCLRIDRRIGPVTWLVPGSQSGRRLLTTFCENKLKAYSALRNNPSVDGLSNLSPFFHFGQLAPQRAILAVSAFAQTRALQKSAEKWIEEALIFRELADNFCWYQPLYDSLQGAPTWAQQTLQKHSADNRFHKYSIQQFEGAQTHSTFWNAMQTQLMVEGKLHGVRNCISFV